MALLRLADHGSHPLASPRGRSLPRSLRIHSFFSHMGCTRPWPRAGSGLAQHTFIPRESLSAKTLGVRFFIGL